MANSADSGHEESPAETLNRQKVCKCNAMPGIGQVANPTEGLRP